MTHCAEHGSKKTKTLLSSRALSTPCCEAMLRMCEYRQQSSGICSSGKPASKTDQLLTTLETQHDYMIADECDTKGTGNIIAERNHHYNRSQSLE